MRMPELPAAEHHILLARQLVEADRSARVMTGGTQTDIRTESQAVAGVQARGRIDQYRPGINLHG